MKQMPGLIALAVIAMALCGHTAGQAQNASPADALKAATQAARNIEAATGASASAGTDKLPSGDPCTVLSMADLQKVFPGSKAGERSRRLEKYGSTECIWKGANGQLVLALQESYSSGDAKGDMQGMAMGFTDPLNPQARNSVRIEAFKGIGTDAAAFVEVADPKRGILNDGAMMSLRRGEHTLMLMSPELTRRDRAAALTAFEQLGAVAAKRLQ